MLVDAHSHLDKYEDKLDAALEEIVAHQIITVSNSMDLSSYERNLEIAERCSLVLPTFGVHPWRAPEHEDRLEALRETIARTPMVGEIGLDFDFVTDASQYPAQKKVFEFLLEVAREEDKVVNLHTKGGEKEVLELLERYDIKRAIVHWYSGPVDVFRRLVERSTFFTMGVEVYHSRHIQSLAQELPSELLLTETDNPGGAEWLTGTIGMPSLIKEVVQCLARVRGTTPEDIEKIVHGNFLRLVQDDRWLAPKCLGLLRGEGGGAGA